jgi:hypothetical protein
MEYNETVEFEKALMSSNTLECGVSNFINQRLGCSLSFETVYTKLPCYARISALKKKFVSDSVCYYSKKKARKM